MWNQRHYSHNVEIEVQKQRRAWTVTMEFRPDSTEQILVHPKSDAEPEVVQRADIRATYVPPMSGLSIDEPVYTQGETGPITPGQGRPGEIIRNLLLRSQSVSRVGSAQRVGSKDCFAANLLVPDGAGADIICEFQPLAEAVESST